MNRFFTNKTKAASLLRGLLLLSIMMLTSVGTWAQDGEGPPTEVSVSDTAALKNALESTTASTINMTESITLTEEVKIAVGADHTLSIAEGKTLTCTVKRGIWVNNNITLTIQGGTGSKLEINVDGGGYAISDGTLTLNNITVDITSGIFAPTILTVGTGATINVDAADQAYPLSISRLTVDNGGTININTFKEGGININTALTINNGGTVKVGNGTDANRGIIISIGASIVLNGGTLEGTGDKGGNIYLPKGAKVTGMNGKLVDQGNELSQSGEVPVVEENAEPSTTGLTQGLYTWDKSTSKFVKPNLKEGYTLNSETGALTISSQTGMANWMQNGQGSNGKDVKSVEITGDVTEIVGSPFTFCPNLTQVTITASGITDIRASAFSGTTSLTTIEIPASVTTIEGGAFSGSGISTFTVAKDNNSFKTVDEGKALLTNDGKTLVAFAPSATGSYTIPDEVETIGNSSFQGTAITSLEIPSSVKTIGKSAFYLSALTSLVIPESVTTIEENAFFRSAITSIVIPSSVTSIEYAAFAWSGALTTVTFEGATAPTIGEGIFANCNKLTDILVPASATGYTGGNVSENWKTWATYIKAGQAQGQTQTDGDNTVPDGGTLTGNGTTEATKVTPQGDATLENVKTQATEVAVGTISVITLTGTSNALGAITVGSGGNLTLTANEGTSVTVTSVANSGTFTDNTGSVTKVTGNASLDLSAGDAMPSDQTATGQVTLTAKPTVAEGADVSYQWQKQENGSWTDVSNPYTRAAVAGSPDFTTSISGTYRCRITVEKGSVSTTLLTQSATATVNSIPDPEPTYYTVTLPSVEGAATDPVAGDYDVESWDNFRFYLTLDADYNQSVPVVTTDRGETITPRTSDGAYIVKYVRSDLVISIGGIVKNPPPVANAEIQSGTRIFTRDGSLFITTDRPARAQVIALTGQLIRSLDLPVGTTRVDALAIGVYIVRLDDGMTRKVIIGR